MVIYRLGLPYYKEFDNFQFIALSIKIRSVNFLILVESDGFFVFLDEQTGCMLIAH